MERDGLYFGGHFGRVEVKADRILPIIAASYLDIMKSHEDIGAVVRTLNDATVPIEDLMKYGEILIHEGGSAKISYFESKHQRGQIILRTWDGERKSLPSKWHPLHRRDHTYTPKF